MRVNGARPLSQPSVWPKFRPKPPGWPQFRRHYHNVRVCEMDCLLLESALAVIFPLPPPSFARPCLVLRKSLLSLRFQTSPLPSAVQAQGWCDSCKAYKPTQQSKRVRRLPALLALNCAVERADDRSFWLQRMAVLRDPVEPGARSRERARNVLK